MQDDTRDTGPNNHVHVYHPDAAIAFPTARDLSQRRLNLICLSRDPHQIQNFVAGAIDSAFGFWSVKARR